MEDFVGDLLGGVTMENMQALITAIGQVLKCIVSTTTELTDLWFVFVPMAFVFTRKAIGMSKGLLFYSRGRGRR